MMSQNFHLIIMTSCMPLAWICEETEWSQNIRVSFISKTFLHSKLFNNKQCNSSHFHNSNKRCCTIMQQHLKIIKQQLFLYRDEKARSISIFCAPTLPLTQQQSTNSIGALLLRYVHLPKRPMGMATLFNTRSTRCGFREFWCRRSGNPVPWFNKHNFSPLDPNEHVNISIW